jgi:hypothetical protein
MTLQGSLSVERAQNSPLLVVLRAITQSNFVGNEMFFPVLYLLQKNNPPVLKPRTLSYLEEDIDHETQNSYHPAFVDGLINGL